LPTPTVNSISDITVCAGDTISQINFTSSQSGVNFIWTSTNANIGLATSGNGNILSFVSNAVTQQEIATISVQAVDAICYGPVQKFRITVNPLPTKPIVGNVTQPTCSLATGSVNLSGLPTIGTWTVYATPVSGSGSATLSLTGSGSNATFSGLNQSTVYSFLLKFR